jgi:hypothetical protein
MKTSAVYFDDITHSYYLGERRLMGVTALMKKHGLSTDYSDIPQHILEKAAERGTRIHKDIEVFVKSGEILSREASAFSSLGLTAIESEFLVSDNEMVASSIDLVLSDFSLADIKCTSKLNLDPLAWQLSIYKYLFERQTGLRVPGLFGIHICNGKAKVIEVAPIPKEDVERLFECERNGVLYNKREQIELPTHELQEWIRVEDVVLKLKNDLKTAEQQSAAFRERFYELMTRHNVKQIDNESVKITMVLPTTTTRVDSKKLQSDFPEVYESVLKESPVKGGLRITIKQ